jgi:hypothetical protein
MKYEIIKNNNGTITQCERNADGGNIYAQREEINKKALENLQRPTPGKLGDLSNLQIINFSFTDTGWPSGNLILEYNTTVTTANVTDCVMFGVDGLTNKAQYFNLVDISVSLFNDTQYAPITNDSYIEWYILENTPGTSSLGRKIPRRFPIFGADSSATFDFTVDGAKQGYQYISTPVVQSNNPINTIMPNGIRCSGIALKTIHIQASQSVTWADVSFNVVVQLDTTSVSSSY